jgi:hypothetical protein
VIETPSPGEQRLVLRRKQQTGDAVADAVFQIYKAEFDLAFRWTMFILTQHPYMGGRRSRIVQLDRLITSSRNPALWFAP